MNQLAKLLQKHFATNQNYFLEQQTDGSYRKRSGEVTFKRIVSMLDQRKSIAVLQRNIDFSVKWICFDFDILKDLLSSEMLPKAEAALQECVYEFWSSLKQLSIACVVEFSGNRGFHVWITFDNPLNYSIAYDLQQKILKDTAIEFDKKLVALDLFPRSRSPSGGVGSGVKIPMSLHAKSGAYSRLIASTDDLQKDLRSENLDRTLVEECVSILSSHKGLPISQVESILERLVGDEIEESTSQIHRISSIKIEEDFILDDLLEHWEKSPVFSVLAKKITKREKLKNDERKLLVGLLARVVSSGEFSCEKILHEIFSKMANYDALKTRAAINNLSNFLFPSRAQIESILRINFPDGTSDLDIVKSCIPNYISHSHNDFKILEKDIEVARVAELNYVRTNDEVQVRKVINTLAMPSATKNLHNELDKLLLHPDRGVLYVHNRKEPKKVRKLITLGAAERVATSAAMKQIIHHFELKPSSNSYGYCVNRGFKGGHIFEPWLSRWVNFISNIGVVVGEAGYSDFYIVKTDIRSFYDDIPHDGVKRLLLEGVNQQMSTKISTLSQDVLEDYKNIVNLFFGIARTASQKPIGLPQGPAYARWLAELYISSLDEYFDLLLKEEAVYFYQRFVDDIFFVVPDEAAASGLLQQVRQRLAQLGLQINDEKTIVRKISDFTPDFDRYKSQSKYVVDKISKKFDDASEGEKDNAIEEFLRLAQADTYAEDLSFIYSHLTAVESLNIWKREHLLPVIRAGEGRGSLYRHIFRFALDDSEACELLNHVEIYNDLQSEVLTEVLLEQMQEHSASREKALQILNDVKQKITVTPVVLEHLAFISLYHGIGFDIYSIKPSLLVETLRRIENPSLLKIPEGLIDYINTELNAIAEPSDFMRLTYSICAAPNVESTDLNKIARIFFAKIGYAEASGGLSVVWKEDNKSVDYLAKLYYLICLFSVSTAGNDVQVKSAWRHCLLLCNDVEMDNFNEYSDEWLQKIGCIDIDLSKVMLILSSVVDGNIIRSVDDRRNLFGRYHTGLLVYFVLNKTKSGLSGIDAMLQDLSQKARFYAWLISSDQVTIFPDSNKNWFDKNLLENDIILLKKNAELLIRRPTESFLPSSVHDNSHLGFSEIVVDYNVGEVDSIKNIVAGFSFVDQLDLLCRLLEEGAERGSYPNFFQRDPMISSTSLRSISPEMDNAKKILFEELGGHVIVSSNDKSGFIRFFLQIGSMTPGSWLEMFDDRYVKKIEGDAGKFIFGMHKQMQLLEVPVSDLSVDLAAASAVYLLLDDGDEDIFKIRSFVSQYQKFHPNSKSMNVFAVDENTQVADSDPLSLLDSIVYSLSLLRRSGFGSLPFYLDKDVNDFKIRLIKISSDADSAISLGDFMKASINISILSQRVNLNGVDWDFEKVRLIHSASNCIKVFSQEFAGYVRSSEHVYFHAVNDLVYVVALDASITKCFRVLQDRVKLFSTETGRTKSLPSTESSVAEHRKISRWTQAVDVLQEHRGVDRMEAELLLHAWVGYIPKKFRENLITLIASHEVMSAQDREGFLDKVEQLLASSMCVFLLKRQEDHNGTHRLLYSRDDLGRKCKKLNIAEIKNNVTEATIVVDLIISGSQAAGALRYYLSKGATKYVNGCYVLDEHARESLRSRLAGLTKLHICCVLYTAEAINFLKSEISTVLGHQVDVDVVYGRDVGRNAFFETTEKIGPAEKMSLKNFLLDKDVILSLNQVFVSTRRDAFLNEDVLNKTNLVARYRSVPKKCFWFLPAPLRADAECSALLRIKEVS